MLNGWTDEFDFAQFGKYLFALLFGASLVTANLTATKLAVYDFPIIGELTGSVAAFMIGVSFLMSDLLSEIYGKRTTRYIVNATIVAVALAWGMVAAAVSLPASPAYGDASAFNTVFSASYPILLASVTSLLLSQNLDVSIFHAVRDITGRKHKWARNIASTGTSQLLDTAVFTWLAFIVFPPMFGQPTIPFAVTLSIITAEYLIKLTVAGLDTGVFYVLSGAADRAGITAHHNNA